MIFGESRGVSQKVDNNLRITIIILVTISYECDSYGTYGIKVKIQNPFAYDNNKGTLICKANNVIRNFKDSIISM